MDSSWISLLPFLVVIPIAIWLKEILPGLVLGLLVGSYAVNPHWIGGLEQSVDYVLHTLSKKENVIIVSFLYLFGALVGMMQISGGVKGFVESIGQRIHSERSLMMFLWLTVPFTFFTPMFRIMMIGPVVKSIISRIQMSKERLGFALDVSTEPIIVLLPVATAFVGFMTSVVAGAMEQNGLQGLPYSIFVSSIPFNFFAWIALVYGLFSTFRRTGAKGSHRKESEEKGEGNDLHRSGIRKELAQVKGQAWHLIFPLALLLVLTFYLLWRDGVSKGAENVLDAFSIADAALIMLLAIFATLIASILLYMLRRQPLNEILYHFFDGGNQLMMPIILLILVWSVSLSAEDLGFSSFVSSTLGTFLPGAAVPAIVFLAGSFISYFIGTSWGTWGLFMPLGVTLAAATGGSIPMTVGAVFASGTFGAFASPLGDTTITTSSIMDMDIIEYARYKLKVSLICGGLSFLLYLAGGIMFA